MKGLPEERTIRLAQYMIEQKATVRQTAARFGISKSTVHIEVMKMSGSFGLFDNETRSADMRKCSYSGFTYVGDSSLNLG